MNSADQNTARRRMAPQGMRVDWLERPGGVKLRAAYWQATQSPSNGTVILLHGWREFIEKYYETVADLLGRGYGVATMDWRGQGLSTRPLADRQKGYARSFDGNLDDVDALIDQTLSAGLPEPLFLMAHSFGGNCALRYLGRSQGQNKDKVIRAVLLAPMVGINFDPLPASFAPLIIKGALKMGLGQTYAPFQSAYGEADRMRQMDVLTSDPDRMADEIMACRANPDLALGGVTYGWLGAALDAIKDLERPGLAEGMRLPMLFALAGDERVVDNKATRRLIKRLPDARVHEIPGARHEILKERDVYRDRFWAAFDDFMRVERREG